MASETLYRARMQASRENLDALMELCSAIEPPPTAWEDVDTGDAWLEIYSPDRDDLDNRARSMIQIAETLDGRVHAAPVTAIPAEDWTEAWKKFFHTTRISDRIIIHPVWEEFTAEPGDIVIDIDPGMSFGTGLHPTTRSCLRFLDTLASAGGVDEAAAGGIPLSSPVLRRLRLCPIPCSVTDIGCGSGILAIAAAKLGFAPVHATDYDPLAVKIARENIIANGLAVAPPEASSDARPALRCLHLSHSDVLTDPIPPSHILIANILAPVLIEAAPRITAALIKGTAGGIPPIQSRTEVFTPQPDNTAGGSPVSSPVQGRLRPCLILSGILDTQFPEVAAAYARYGFTPVETILDGPWRSALFQKLGI